MNFLINKVHKFLNLIEVTKIRVYNEPCIVWNIIQINQSNKQKINDSAEFFLNNIFNGFLFAVPKNRRTVEKRLLRKLGVDRWGPPGAKMLKPKFNLIICDTCGNYNEKNYLCPVCYKKVEEETKIVQRAIVNNYKLEPITKEVLVRYNSDPKEEVKNRRLVEVEKERPPWFSKNLLAKLGQTIPAKNVIINEELIKSQTDDK